MIDNPRDLEPMPPIPEHELDLRGCYKERVYCTYLDCDNLMCLDNQQRIDSDDYEKSGLPLAMQNKAESCTWRLYRLNLA